jgi:hypothetical protein
MQNGYDIYVSDMHIAKTNPKFHSLCIVSNSSAVRLFSLAAQSGSSLREEKAIKRFMQNALTERLIIN